MKLDFQDISAEVYGKYQYCTKAKDGMWYADSDFESGCGVGPLKRGALPAPHQDTPELTAKAKTMHEKAAHKATTAVLGEVRTISSWDRWKIFLGGMANLRLTIGVITLVLLATLIGMAPAILTAMYQH